MSRNRIVRIVLAGMMGLAALVAAPTAASAAVVEWNTAVAGTPPSSITPEDCVSTAGSTACYEAYGDVWWVRDTAADSASAVADWENQTATAGRYGYCVNKLGNGKWGYCNKNYSEGSILFFVARVYDGSEEEWRSNTSGPKTVYA